MKKIFTFLLFLTTAEFIYGQDLIITNKGDSLNCKITKIKPDYIYFTFKYDNSIRNTFLPVNDVVNYKKDFYSNPAFNLSENIKQEDFDKFEIGFTGGLSFLTAKLSDQIDPQLRSYARELKSGYHYGGNLGIFWSETVGAGAKYSVFNSKNERSFNIDNEVLRVKDNITIQFIAPGVVTRLYSANKKTKFSSGIYIGYLSYRNDANVNGDFIIKSNMFGAGFDFGLDLPLSKKLLFVLGTSFTGGSFKEFTIKNVGFSNQEMSQTSEQAENISRIDLSAGLKLGL